MANEDKPNGARPIGTYSGSSWCGKVRPYLADGSGDDIFVGDFVTLEADGFVNAANAAETLLGVCVGFQPAQAGQTNGVTDHFAGNSSFDLDKTYYDASVDGESWVMVAVGPDVLYEMQSDGIITYLDKGNNAEIVATAGDATRGISQQEVSSTTGTGTAQLRLVDPVNRTDNDITLANSRWIVSINEHHMTVIDDGGTVEGGEGI